MMSFNNQSWKASAAISMAMLGLTASFLLYIGGSEAEGRSAGTSAFLGASSGVAVPWQNVPLPPVIVSPYNDPPTALASAFTPTFEQLVTQHTIIETVDQWKHVWRRLYNGEPWNPTLIDFETHFVLLVGGGLQHPFFGFAINDIEETIGEFEQVMPFGDPAQEPALAVRVVLTYPGAKPPKMDFEWRVVAATIPREYLEPIILNRQILAAP